MPYISLGNEAPGILSLFEYRPETAKPLCELAEVLLRGRSTLSRGERELMASYVSALNDCSFCTDSHAAFAAAQLPGGM
ncbi:MAG: carboxymuconolactone decarboxylase family protein, partial [Streptosporangiaceae bacterium]